MQKYLAPIAAFIQTVVPPLLLWVSGFFFSMLWFMLMADTLIAGTTSPEIPAATLTAIITFYTVIFGPMTWLVKIVFGLGLLAMTLQLFIKDIPWYLRVPIFVTNAPPIFMAALYIIPLVDTLITNSTPPAVQAQSIRTVHAAHLLAASCVALMIVLQLAVVIGLQKRAEKKRLPAV